MKLVHLFDFDSLQLWIPTSFVQPPRDTLWWIYVVSWRLDQEFLTFSSSRKWGKPRNCDGISTRYCCEMEEMLNLVFFFCSSSLKLRSQILWWIFQRTSTARTKISLWSIFSRTIFKITRLMCIWFVSWRQATTRRAAGLHHIFQSLKAEEEDRVKRENILAKPTETGPQMYL